jgi:hypothetical protein
MEAPASLLRENVSIEKLSQDEITFMQDFKQQKKRVLEGESDLTPKYWVRYMNLVDRQCKLYSAIETNNYHLRLEIWNDLKIEKIEN